MDQPHSNCSKECLQCVLAWYNQGTSDEEDEEVEETMSGVGESCSRVDDIVVSSSIDFDVVVPDSLDPDSSLVVPDSLDPEVLETPVPNTDCVVESAAGGSVSTGEEVKCVPKSASDIKFDNYVKRFIKNQRDKQDKLYIESLLRDEEISEAEPETPSLIRMREYEERFLARKKKSSK